MKALLVAVVFSAALVSLGLAQGDYYARRPRYGYGHNRYRYTPYGYGYKRCPKLDDPKNGKVQVSSLKPGGKAVYSCDKGYVLSGDKIRICQKNGVWSGKAPICKPIDCGQPPQADINGDVTYVSTTLGSTATFTCDPGYELENGEETFTIYCLASGKWSDSAPKCLPVDCGEPPAADENGDVAFDSTTFRSTAIYSCDDGYLLDFSNGGSQHIYCQANGDWSGTAPDCVRIDCGFLPAPKYGKVEFVPDTRLGSYAQFSCIKGFKLVGDKVRRCQSNGDWSSSQPRCQRIKYGHSIYTDGYDTHGYGPRYD